MYILTQIIRNNNSIIYLNIIAQDLSNCNFSFHDRK